MFDTMAVDLFRFQNGKVFEGSMSLRSKQNEVDIENPDIFNRMVNVYQYADTPIDFYLNLNDGSAEHDKSIIYDDILRWYKDYYLVKDSKSSISCFIPSNYAKTVLIVLQSGRITKCFCYLTRELVIQIHL